MRHLTIDSILEGDFDVYDPDEENVGIRSPNYIQVALEDTSEAASMVPTLRVRPTGTDKEGAAEQERIGAGYWEANDIEQLISQSIMDLGAYGLAAWTILPDDHEKPRTISIERRDPRQCYPEPGHRPGQKLRRCLFARAVHYTTLPEEWRRQIWDYHLERTGTVPEYMTASGLDENTMVVIVEYFDEWEYIIGAIWKGAASSLQYEDTAGAEQLATELYRWTHDLEVCPVVVEGRLTYDGEFRGQYDQAIGMLEAHIRLMGMVLDYADQAVYSDVWVRDLIGEMSYGGGSYIQLGPQGAIGRVPPAVSSLNIQEDLQNLAQGIHLAGRWPSTRPGEVDQSQASGKFVETTMGMMNTVIRTYHKIMRRLLSRATRIAFTVDKKLIGGKRRTAGILRNQEFMVEYSSSDIDLDNIVRVDYGLGLGKTVEQSAVLHLQYGGEKYISKEFVQENIDGLADVARENSRIDVQDFSDMAKAKLMMGLEQGTIPEEALIQMAKAREQGQDLFKLYDKYIVQPKKAMEEELVPTGLGAPMMPGLPPPPPGPPGAPGAPPGPAPMPPAPPEGADLLSRLNVPAGPGGVLGSQVLSEAGQ